MPDARFRLANPGDVVVKAVRMLRSACSFLPLPLLALAACGQQTQVERIDLEEVETRAQLALTPSTDSENASWQMAPDGLGILYGPNPQAPYLSLTCQLTKGAEPKVAVIHHAHADPGAKALFAVLGSLATVRLKLDARQSENGWRWEGTYPADAPELAAFAGPRGFEATMPGAGMLKASGSSLPGEFVGWCRKGGTALLRPAHT